MPSSSSRIFETTGLEERFLGLVAWDIQPNGAGSTVRLSAEIPHTWLPDRIFLTLGGRAWLRRLIEARLPTWTMPSEQAPTDKRPSACLPVVMERMKAIPELEMIPVIVITARDPSEGEKAVAMGARSFFHKPFEIDSLVAEIRQALGS